MEIFIDEAGSFVSKGAARGAWCVAAAFSVPETDKRKVREILRNLKVQSGFSYSAEVKLHQLSEDTFIRFLNSLSNTNGTLYAVVTDSHLNSDQVVCAHRDRQASSICAAIPTMKYEGGKAALALLSKQLQSVPPQLYSQLVCQVYLMEDFTNKAINYYVQRIPNSLRCFKWRIDQKQPTHKTDFEDAFEKYTPGLMQTFSIEKPSARFSWCDYSPMSKYTYAKGDIPEYLVHLYPHLKNESALDIQKIIREDMRFVDSKKELGIQVVDLLASGFRRLLRCEWGNNEKMAEAFGKLFVQSIDDSLPIKIISFGNSGHLSNSESRLVRVLSKNARSMFLRV